MKSKVSDIEKFENLIKQYRNEKESKKKQVIYLELVQESLTLVKKIANNMAPLPKNIIKDDLIQVGALGILKAIDTYDLSGKGSFKTYATKFVKGKIMHYMRDKVNIVKTSRFVVEHYTKVKEAIEELSDEENNIYPSTEEIAKKVRLPVDKVEEIINAELITNTISLDQRVFSDDSETLADRIPNDEDDSYEKYYENKKIIEFALNKLGKTDKHVIKRYYIDGATKKDISEEIKVSQVQVARIIKKALVKMYNIIKCDLDKEGK